MVFLLKMIILGWRLGVPPFKETPIWGRWSYFDEHIFQMGGSSSQLDKYRLTICHFSLEEWREVRSHRGWAWAGGSWIYPCMESRWAMTKTHGYLLYIDDYATSHTVDGSEILARKPPGMVLNLCKSWDIYIIYHISWLAGFLNHQQYYDNQKPF